MPRTVHHSDLEKIIVALMSSAPVQRLAHISHFGAFEFDEWHKPSAQPPDLINRLQHSIGVTAVASAVVDIGHLDEHAAVYNVLYGVLHDVGHGPFSHSSEPVFRHLGIDHHIAYKEIVFDTSPDGIGTILRDFGVELADFYRFTSRTSDDNLFSHRINPDLVDGLTLSTRRLLGREYVVDQSLVSALAFPETNSAILDHTWSTKRDVYIGAIATSRWKTYDLLFSLALYRIFDALNKNDFYLNDMEFLDKFGRRISSEIWGTARGLNRLERALMAGDAGKASRRDISIDYQSPLTDRRSMSKRYIDNAM